MSYAHSLRPDLFNDPARYPVGFQYRAEALSKGDEASFVKRSETLPFKPFEFHGYLGHRRIVSYGFRYDFSGRALQTAIPIPDFLQPLRDIASSSSGIAVEALEQALVTEYAPGAGIGW